MPTNCPYHCEELQNRADLEPLAEALAYLGGTDRSAIDIEDGEPTQTQGVEDIRLSGDPLVRGVVGAFGTAALGVFGKKFARWFWDYFRSWRPKKEQQSLIGTVVILPPAGVLKDQRLPVHVEFEIAPEDHASPVYIPVGQSRAELENRVALEFEQVDLIIGALRRAWQEGNIPPNISYASVERDPERGGYRIDAHYIRPDGLDIVYRGTRELVWRQEA